MSSRLRALMYSTQSLSGPPTKILESGASPLDHFVRRRQAESKVAGRTQERAGHNENVESGQRVPMLFRIALGPLAPKVKRALRRQGLYTVLPQDAHQAITLPRQRGSIDRDVLESRYGVLHHGTRKTPAKSHLRGKHRVLELLTFRSRHQRRDSQIAQSLPGRNQHLGVTVGNEGPWVNRRRAVETSVVEPKPAVGLIR